VGNVSIKDEAAFAHVHITLADHDGRAFGGHCAGGTIVFAAEFIVQVFAGVDLVWWPDPTTGLGLWQDR
jgi:predicted DNA-binding protein with PD1-like motif